MLKRTDYSKPDNITIDDAHVFTSLVKSVHQIDTKLGNNSLAQSFQIAQKQMVYLLHTTKAARQTEQQQVLTGNA